MASETSRDSPNNRQDQSGRGRARRINNVGSGGTSRRSTNACHRCKSKKLKCHYGVASTHARCVACVKAGVDCVFDIFPDGIPRGAEYIAALESRVQLLEAQLDGQAHPPASVNLRDFSQNLAGNATARDLPDSFDVHNPCLHDAHPTQTGIQTQHQRAAQAHQHKPPISLDFCVTVFNLVQKASFIPRFEIEELPHLPSQEMADQMFEAAYLYTQARYCILDWIQVRAWHELRENICNQSTNTDEQSQTGSFFIWIVYAIGAQFVAKPEHCPTTYFKRALIYLPFVLQKQNLSTVQALLALVQYSFRASGAPSMWHLVGSAMRLCIELNCHREAKTDSEAFDPYTLELRKRLFWCTYCFDRLISILSKCPFGVHDVDIEIQIPVDVDVTCNDPTILRNAREMQAANKIDASGGSSIPTTMSSALHHLQIYRIRSRITTELLGPHALPPSQPAVFRFLSELRRWRDSAPRRHSSKSFPQQSEEFIHATYLQAVLLLIRPVLIRPEIDSQLLEHCVTLSAEACRNVKRLSLSKHTHVSPIQVYNCFYCGVTLLLGLAMKGDALPLQQSVQSVSACCSALAVYTRSLPSGASFLQLFEKLCEVFYEHHDASGINLKDSSFIFMLHKILSSDPSKTPELYRSLFEDTGERDSQGLTTTATERQSSGQSNQEGLVHSVTSIQDSLSPTISRLESFSDFELPPHMVPFGAFPEILHPDHYLQDLTGFGPWLE